MRAPIPTPLWSRRLAHAVDPILRLRSPGFAHEYGPEIAASLAALSNIGLDVNEGVTAMRGLLQAQHGRAWYEPRQPRGARFLISLGQAGVPAS